LKEVDAQEEAVRFWQEIYDEQGNLVEVHEKYPVEHEFVQEDDAEAFVDYLTNEIMTQRLAEET
ncbi:MAG: hypothetical protein ACXWXL_11115, partial [Candidatus Binatia bacterium]